MATKRQPSKQRRQSENQRQRAALETRRVNAAAADVGDGKGSGGPSSKPTSDGTSNGSAGGGSVLSRLRGATTTGRAIRTGQAPGSSPVGYRAALAGLLAGVAAAVVGALLITIPIDDAGEPIATKGALLGEWSLSAWDSLQESPEATADEVVDAVDEWSANGDEPYGKAYWPISLGLLLPVVGAALAFRAVSKRASAKVVNRTMYATLFGTLLNAQLLFLFLPTIIGVGIAAFQVRRAELAANAAPAAGDADDTIIDVEEAVESDQLLEADEAADDDLPDALVEDDPQGDEPQRNV